MRSSSPHDSNPPQYPRSSAYSHARSQRALNRLPRSLNRLSHTMVLLLSTGLVVAVFAWMAPKSSPPAPSEDVSFNTPISRSRQNQDQTETLGQPSSQASNQTSAQVAEATVCVKGILPDGTEVCASGVSIDPELAGIDPSEGSVVITNYHVVIDAGGNPPVQLGGKGELYNSKIIRQSPAMDLALLLVPDVQLPIAALAEASPTERTPVRAIGFPNNGSLTIRDSELLGETQNCLAIPPCLVMQQGTITHGNSGGPLEANGQVIGINQGETLEEIAIPIEQVRQFLAGQVPTADQFPPQIGAEQPWGRPSGYPPPMTAPPGYYPPPPGRYPVYPPPPVPGEIPPPRW